MTFAPRVLKPGWLTRCFTNAVKLSLRHPIAWLCIYILPLAVSEFIREVPLLMLLAGFVIIGGTVLAFKGDIQSGEPLHKIVRRVFSTTYVFLVAAIAVWMISWLSLQSGGGLISKQDATFSFFGRFSIGFEYLFIGVAIVATALMAIEIILKIALIFSSTEPPALHAVGMFSIHLSIEQGMSIVLAGKLSREAVSLNISKLWVLVFLLLGCIIFPPFFGLLVPFMYCMYREIFWGVGLVESRRMGAYLATTRPQL